MRDKAELAAFFKRLGAPNPELWAASQADEGINQLHRFLFLRQAWREVLPENDDTWIDRSITHAETNPCAPYSGAGHALKQLIDGGASRPQLTEMVRAMQAELLFSFCYLLDDPQIAMAELSDIGWRLVEADEFGEPNGVPIGGLHESVLETDPTGREMRPKVSPE
nr:hypothetical protein [uncultured Sphingomonas sp.]